MNNKQIAAVLKDIGVLLELNGENPFKTRAYANAARQIETWPEPVETLVNAGRLGEIHGLGPALIQKVTELVHTGELAYYERLKASVPEGLREMLSISGLGAKKVRAIYERLGIATVGELEYACRENRLVKLEGFGARTQERVRKGIELLKRYRGHHLIDRALGDARRIVEALKRCPAIGRAAVAGDARRRMEVVHDLDIVASAASPEAVAETLRPAGDIHETKPGPVSLTLESGLSARIHPAPDNAFAVALVHWTGSEAHRERLAAHARKNGMTLDETRITRNGAVVACAEEADVYRALGLEYIPPELREGGDEVDAAARQALPELVTGDRLMGVLHVHTAYSDGAHTVREMAEAARERGYRYLAICDHSKSAGYAHGLDADRVRRQQAEIDALNAQYGDFRILKGIESDILPDGSLDYPDDVLETFDLIVASVHSGFNMSEAAMTERIVRAIRNPRTTILGHPTGRLLLAREGYAVNIERIIREAVEHRVAIEINANPHRLDMDWRHLRFAREQGARIAIGPDAHQTAELDYVDYGVGIARKGWLTAGDVVNTMAVDDFMAWCRDRKG